MTKEIWKQVDGHPDYEVSNLGRVRSLERVVRCGPPPGTRRIAAQILKPQVVKSTGYLQVELNRKRHSVHRLVATAWCQNWFKGAVVDHLNGNRADNRASNLEWVTMKENIRRGTASEARIWKGKMSARHPTSKAVISTCIHTGQETFWHSAMDAVRAGFRSDCISRACRGIISGHGGRRWRFAEYGDRHGVEWSEPHPDERAA